MNDFKYKNLYIPHKILGHFKAPGGKGIKQFEVLKTTAHCYAIKAMTSNLTHAEARMYYESCYSKSIGYVLGQLSFTTAKELEEIEQEAI